MNNKAAAPNPATKPAEGFNASNCLSYASANPSMPETILDKNSFASSWRLAASRFSSSVPAKSFRASSCSSANSICSALEAESNAI